MTYNVYRGNGKLFASYTDEKLAYAMLQVMQSHDEDARIEEVPNA